MAGIQQLRLFNALKKFTNFKNEKILNALRKAMYGKQIGDMM